MVRQTRRMVDSSWNVMAQGYAWEGKWRGNWRKEWVASTLHTTSEHGVPSITNADAQAQNLNCRAQNYPSSAHHTEGFVRIESLTPASRPQLKCDGTQWRTGGEVKGKLANGVSTASEHGVSTEWVASTLHTTSEHGVTSITTADAHTSAVSSRLNWPPPGRLKWTRPFRRKTKSGFCACAITFKLASNLHVNWPIFRLIHFSNNTKQAKLITEMNVVRDILCSKAKCTGIVPLPTPLNMIPFFFSNALPYMYAFETQCEFI